jgi:hypothetical protein
VSHPITEDYGLLKPAPHSALPDIISVIETPRVYRAPLAPASLARSALLAVLTSLTPPVGAGALRQKLATYLVCIARGPERIHELAFLNVIIGFHTEVAFAAAAVKGLRFAAINCANLKTVRFALDCLPRYGSEVYKSCLTQLRNLRFIIPRRHLAGWNSEHGVGGTARLD